MSYNYMSIIKKILRTLNINKLFYEFNLAMHSMILYYFLWSYLLILARFEGGGWVSFVPFLKKLYRQYFKMYQFMNTSLIKINNI